MNEIARKSFEIAKVRGQLNESCLSYLKKEVEELEEAYNAKEKSVHLPCYTNVEEELADVILVAFSTLHGMGSDVEKLIKAKLNFNEMRSEKKIGEKFTYGDMKYTTVHSASASFDGKCSICALSGYCVSGSVVPPCGKEERSDLNEVYYVTTV